MDRGFRPDIRRDDLDRMHCWRRNLAVRHPDLADLCRSTSRSIPPSGFAGAVIASSGPTVGPRTGRRLPRFRPAAHRFAVAVDHERERSLDRKQGSATIGAQSSSRTRPAVRPLRVQRIRYHARPGRPPRRVLARTTAVPIVSGPPATEHPLATTEDASARRSLPIPTSVSPRLVGGTRRATSGPVARKTCPGPTAAQSDRTCRTPRCRRPRQTHRRRRRVPPS